jgi:hypothetical protein
MKGHLIAENPNRNLFLLNALLVLAMLVAASQAMAQVPVDENGEPLPVYSAGTFDDSGTVAKPVDPDELLTATELQELVGPVALYPDDLLAIVLPATTYPLEIVQAARFLEQLETDSSLEPDEEWDESIVALLNYPDVVRMLDEDIDWTWRLGEAVISQQNEVIAAVEAFRDRAYAAGNLKSDEHQKVSYDEGIIEIVPVSEEIIYVPYYEPAEVVVRQARPVYYYYPDPYPVYYYPYPTGYRFHSGFFWGVTTAYTIGWSNHYLHVYHPSYWGHPYYGRYYYGHYYRRPSITVYNNWYVNNRYDNARYRYRDGDYWRPRSRAGSRQDEPRVRNYHYAPDGSGNRRSSDVGRRDQLQVRDDGRMNLNLRERDSNRVVTGSSQQNRVANSRQTTVNDRVSNSRSERNRAGNREASASVNANRSAASRSRASERQSQPTESRAEIRFRDRTSDAARTNDRGSNRAAVNRPASQRTEATSSDRRTTVTPSQNRDSRQTQASESRASSNRTVNGSAALRTTTSRVAPAPRASQASARQSSTSRRDSAPAARQSAPAPRATAPAIQQRAPEARPAAPSARRSDSGTSRSRQQSKPRVRSQE